MQCKSPTTPRNHVLPLFLGALITLIGSNAQAQHLICGFNSDGKIYDVRPLGPVNNARETGFGSLRSLAFDDAGRLYAMTSTAYEHGEHQVRASLWVVDPSTGAPAWIGYPRFAGQDGPVNWPGQLLFDPSRRAMFMRWSNSLYRIDLATAQLAWALDFQFEQRPPDAPASLTLNGMGFDDAGRLWAGFQITPLGVRPSRSGIAQIDTATGAVASLTPMIYSPPIANGFPPVGRDLVYDPRTRTFLTNDFSTFYRIEPTTGYTTRLSFTALPNSVTTLAGFHPATCIRDTSQQLTFPMVSVVRGGFVHDRLTGDFVQRVRLVADRPIPGPISLLVGVWSSSTGVTVKNSEGVYDPFSYDYVEVLPEGQALEPGVPTDAVLRFGNPSRTTINYFLYVIAGEYSLGP